VNLLRRHLTQAPRQADRWSAASNTGVVGSSDRRGTRHDALFLVSDDAELCTGTVLRVDGGALATSGLQRWQLKELGLA